MESENENSMLNWYPTLKDVEGVKTPKTEIVEAERLSEDKGAIDYDYDEVLEAVEEVGGFPVFIRTDLSSAKHNMRNVSEVREEGELKKKIYDLALDNLCKSMFGLDFKALVVREWLDLKHDFEAFRGDAPIGYEIRAFINGGIMCKHFYWPKGSIEKLHGIHKPPDWEDKWRQTKVNTMKRWEEVKPKVEAVSKVFSDSWSLDFALAEDGTWYAIDMGKYEQSYHPPWCPNAPEECKKHYDYEDEDVLPLEKLEDLIEEE